MCVCVCVHTHTHTHTDIYIYINGFGINNQQFMMGHKTKPNNTKPKHTIIYSDGMYHFLWKKTTDYQCS